MNQKTEPEFKRIRRGLSDLLLKVIADPSIHEIFKLPETTIEERFSNHMDVLKGVFLSVNLREWTDHAVYFD